MGGNFEVDDSFEHTPYTSVSKLFYRNVNQPNKITKPTLKENGRKSYWQTSRNINVQKEDALLRRTRRASDGIFLRPFSKSNFFHGSYSDFYYDSSGIKNGITRSTWLSEHNITSPHNGVLKQFRSTNRLRIDHSDFFVASMEDFSSQYEENDDTNSCLNCSVEAGIDCRSEEENETEETDSKSVGSLIDRRPSNLSVASASWFSSLDFWLDSLPWTKRKEKNKLNKSKRKKSKKHKPSTSSDFVRATTVRRISDAYGLAGKDTKESLSYDTTTEDASSKELHRRKSSVEVFHNACACDGVFGCS